MLVFFCVMIKREVINKIGLLDEKFGVGLGDDDDYCHRAEAAGFRLAFVGNLEIYHKHKATFKALAMLREPIHVSRTRHISLKKVFNG